MTEEYIDIKFKWEIILIGMISGVVASLWTIIPFFVSGIANLIYLTIIVGIIILIVSTSLNKNKLLQSGITAVTTFLIVSYLIVPAISGALLNSDSEAVSFSNGDSEILTLDLPGLFCQGCAFGSENALKSIEGVLDAQVDFDSKEGTVIYDPQKVNPEIILSNNVIKSYGGKAK